MFFMQHFMHLTNLVFILPHLLFLSYAFQAVKPVPPISLSNARVKGTIVAPRILRRMTQLDVDASDAITTQGHGIVVRAPLKYIGLYPCLGLRFPLLTTSNQRQSQKNITGVSLDFMIDTAANLNVIQPAIAMELNLPAVTNQVLPGFTSSGRIDSERFALDGSSNTFMLGDTQLEYHMNGDGSVVSNASSQSQMENDHPFMTQLTASVVPNVACPTAGILSLAFLQVFEGGVECSWGTSFGGNQAPLQPPAAVPSITFYGDKSLDHTILKDRVKVPLRRIPVTQLLSVPLTVNGVTVMALLDTGSPVTVLHPEIAKLANVDTVIPSSRNQKSNPLSSISNRLQEAQAASRGDLLAIMGSDGAKVNLIKSKEPVHITMSASSSATMKDIDFGSTSVFVGEFPGLTMMMMQQKQLGRTGTPESFAVGVILGFDVLRQRLSMLLRAQDNEVWF
jgi:Aspartyl protease